jgi:4'-phosphopantetheinyl transferase
MIRFQSKIQNRKSIMIQWLVQSAAEHRDLSRGIAPPGLLCPGEQRRLAELKLSKRRREWLIGRWTAKHLLQACLEHDLNVHLPLNAIGIYNDARGAPVARVDCGSRIAEWAISISHSQACGFSAALPDGAIGLGADIEHVELREWCFVEDYFTSDEIDRVYAAPVEQRKTLITAIWSAKEAALKALRLGLTLDTRRVHCAIDPRHCSGQDWLAFNITCTPSYTEPLRAWWRTWGDYVLTVAIVA